MMKTNFHTHTFRCGHAVGNEEAMVKSAIEEGIEVLGFSEHVPLPRYRKHIFKGMRYTLNHFRSFAVACKAIITNGPAMRMPYKDKQLHLEEVRDKGKNIVIKLQYIKVLKLSILKNI